MDCPHCSKQLKIGGKAVATISQLAPGKYLRVKCAQCDNFFNIDSQMNTLKIVSEDSKKTQTTTSTGTAGNEAKIVAADGKKTNVIVKPPAAPDLSWLEDGMYDDGEVVEEVPLALVLMRDGKDRTAVINAIEGIGYKAEVAESSTEAIEKMQFINYSNVVVHSKFEGAGIQSSPFHQYMSRMDMSKRRYIFYTVIGPEFKTLYNLQSLAFSANLVVNDNEVKDFNVILRKVIPEYEQLFGPLMEELHVQRK